MTEDRAKTIEEVLRLWAEGHSSGIIAGQVRGVTRNAVIGIVNRARAKGRDVDPKGLRPPGSLGAPRLYKPREYKPKPVFVSPEPLKTREESPPPKSILSLEESIPKPKRFTGVRIYELRGNGCKYPTDNAKNGDHLFCNKARKGEGPYCAEHHAIAYQKQTPLKRMLPSWLR